MCDQFTIEIMNITPTQLAIKLKQEAANQPDVTFTGDETAGSITAGGTSLTYTVAGCVITVQVTSKPFYATCNRVESEIRKFISLGGENPYIENVGLRQE